MRTRSSAGAEFADVADGRESDPRRRGVSVAAVRTHLAQRLPRRQCRVFALLRGRFGGTGSASGDRALYRHRAPATQPWLSGCSVGGYAYYVLFMSGGRCRLLSSANFGWHGLGSIEAKFCRYLVNVRWNAIPRSTECFAFAPFWNSNWK